MEKSSNRSITIQLFVQFYLLYFIFIGSQPNNCKTNTKNPYISEHVCRDSMHKNSVFQKSLYYQNNCSRITI